MTAEKASLFKDLRSVQLIMSSPDPRTHKRIGRGVRNFDSAVREQVKTKPCVFWYVCLINAESSDAKSTFEIWHQAFN